MAKRISFEACGAGGHSDRDAGVVVGMRNGPLGFILPKNDPFMAWAQRRRLQGRQAPGRRQAVPELVAVQADPVQLLHVVRPHRSHAPSRLLPHLGLPNAHLQGFERFISDRALVERFRQQLPLYVGEVIGVPSPGWPGLRPGRW